MLAEQKLIPLIVEMHSGGASHLRQIVEPRMPTRRHQGELASQSGRNSSAKRYQGSPSMYNSLEGLPSSTESRNSESL
jgi:hypothetical protein